MTSDGTIRTWKSERSSEVTRWAGEVDKHVKEWLTLDSSYGNDYIVKEVNLEVGKTMQLPCTWRFRFYFYAPRNNVGLGIDLELANKSQRISGNPCAEFEFLFKFRTREGKSKQKRLGPLSKGFFSETNYIYYDSQWTPESLEIRVEQMFHGVDKIVQNPHEPPDSKKARVIQSQSTELTLDENYQKNLLKNEEDFKIKISDGKEFPVDKTLLSSQSPVFAEMFSLSKNENASSRTIEITDLSSKAMEVILSVVDEKGSSSSVSVGKDWIPVAEELVRAGEKYKLKSVMQFCDKMLVEACSSGGKNAIELLKTSRKFKLKRAEKDVKAWISKNMTIEDVLDAFLDAIVSADVE